MDEQEQLCAKCREPMRYDPHMKLWACPTCFTFVIPPTEPEPTPEEKTRQSWAAAADVAFNWSPSFGVVLPPPSESREISPGVYQHIWRFGDGDYGGMRSETTRSTQLRRLPYKPPKPQKQPTNAEIMARLGKAMQAVADRIATLEEERAEAIDFAVSLGQQKRLNKHYDAQIAPLATELSSMETNYAHLRESIEGVTPDEGALRDGIAAKLLDY